MKKSSKNFILAFCVFVIFVIPIIMFLIALFLKNNTIQPSQTDIPRFFPTSTPAFTIQPSPPLLSPVAVPATWNTDQNTRYALAYPPAWHTESQPAEGRDIYMTFLPNKSASDDAFPVFIVQVYPENLTTIPQKVSELSPLNLQQSAIMFQGNQAVKLSGILPITFITGNPQNKPVFKTYILFEKNNRLYIIDYAYYQDENAGAQQRLFDQMLATLALPQLSTMSPH